MRELLLSNLAKTLPKYTHGKFYLNMLKKCKVDMSYIFKWLQSLIFFEINWLKNDKEKQGQGDKGKPKAV